MNKFKSNQIKSNTCDILLLFVNRCSNTKEEKILLAWLLVKLLSQPRIMMTLSAFVCPLMWLWPAMETSLWQMGMNYSHLIDSVKFYFLYFTNIWPCQAIWLPMQNYHNNKARWPFSRALGHLLDCPSYQQFLGWFGPVTWPLGPPPSPTTYYYGKGSDCRHILPVSSGIFHSNEGDGVTKIWNRYLAEIFLFLLPYNRTS